MRYNIAVAGFHHETNTFSPALTGYTEFLKADGWPGLTRGDDVLQRFPPLNLPIGGFLDAANAHHIIPTCWANAEPYGPVTTDAFNRISSLILDGLSSAESIDAVYLDLHGAMVVEHLQDGEGALLNLIRDKLGSDIPIVVSLDFHANLTPQMFNLSDAITIFRTYPHIDMADTGRRAFYLLQKLLEQEQTLNKAFRQIPYLIPLCDQHTGSEPCNEWYKKLGEANPDGILSTDIACGFPAADIYDCGATVVAYGTSQQAVEAAVTSHYDTILASESQFTNPLLEGNEAIKQATIRGRPGSPVVVADVQDNPGAGGSADTTGVLYSLIENQAHKAVVGSIWDPDAAQAAHAAGVGADITLSLGGRNGPSGVVPLSSSFSVEALSNGTFTCHGAMLAGIELNLGLMALLKINKPDTDIRVVVASERFQCLDQGLFREMGIEPHSQAIVVVKSTVHFRADFDCIAAATLVADFPGANPCRLESVPYKNIRPGVRSGPSGSPIVV